MSASLLAELRDRGVRFVRQDGRLTVEAPIGALTPTLRERLQREKRAIRAALASESAGSGVETAAIVAARERLGAVMISSPRFGEVWVALDPCVAPELAAEEERRTDPRPVLLTGDVARLAGKPDSAIQSVLKAARAFPGARVLQ